MKVAVIGGHLAPALAVIDALPDRTDVVFIGKKSAFEGSKDVALEYQEISKRKIPFVELKTGRFQRSFSRHTITSLSKIPSGFIRAISILRKEKPDVVVSFGGYLSVPVGIAAKVLRIPLVIHEQTFHQGLANKILKDYATKICISWESSMPFFPNNKTVLTGNPLMIKKSGKKLTLQTPIIYVTGGSAGSHAINFLIEKALPTLLKDFSIFHQTGDAPGFNDYERLIKVKSELPKDLSKRYEVVKFVNPDDVYEVMSQAKLIIGRSGVNTVTEVLALGKNALFIPLPSGQRNEQLANAKIAKEAGVADYMLQMSVTVESFISKIKVMMAEEKTGSSQSHKMIITDAAARIVKEVIYVAKKKGS